MATRAAQLGLSVGPVIEITGSRWFNVLNLRTLELLFWLARQRRVKY